MFAKLKDFIVKNKLYVGIGSGALVLCVAVGIVFACMGGGSQSVLKNNSSLISSLVSDYTAVSGENSESGTDSASADGSSAADSQSNSKNQSGSGQSNNNQTALSSTMNKIGNKIYAEDTSKNGYNFNNIVGVDDLGRTFGTLTSEKSEKQIGMFFSAGGQKGLGEPELAEGIYDCSKILAMPNGLKLLTDPGSLDPEISPVWEPHFWAEPLWGYYRARDEWVIYRQLQMLTMAGVDYISFDVSNMLKDSELNLQSKDNAFGQIMRMIIKLRQEGWDAPQIVFFTHSRSTDTVKQLYRMVYKKGIYKEAWYYYKGKPLIVGYTNVEDDIAEAKSRGDKSYYEPTKPTPHTSEVKNFFSWKESQWPQESFKENGLPWMEWSYPAPVHNDVINVTTAAHPSVPMSFSLTRKGWINWGRGWDPIKKVNVAANVAKGSYYQSTWDTAHKLNPNMVFIGEWNEWVSQKQMWDGEYMLCDEVNEEYSRDIEPMKGGFGDNFYMQTLQNTRKFKGVSGSTVGQNKTIDVYKSADQWKNITSIYRSTGKTNMKRDSYGASDVVYYKQDAARNNLLEAKMANDSSNLYLYIRTEKAITDYDGKSNNWMNILIGTGSVSQKGWEGYEYVINRSPKKDGKTSVDKLSSNGKGTSVGSAEYTIDGNVMQVKIPFSVLGSNAKKGIYFKVADGVSKTTDIMDYYISGKSMPFGRVSYQYNPK